MDTNVFGEKSIDDNIYSNGPIEIKNDVWIGAHSVILSGAVIDNGAIVAANSVVTGYVPPYAIVAGSPAKVIKYRFEPEIIELLNELQWWNWDIDKIKANKPFFKNKLKVEDLRMYL
jgi:acetyltransferase-like isoleucine patch superfamily enzyme